MQKQQHRYLWRKTYLDNLFIADFLNKIALIVFKVLNGLGVFFITKLGMP